MRTVDVAVIGLGPGGEHVAGTLAERGLSVLGIEERLLGGECPYWGCVPSKMMIRAANTLAEARRVDGLAGSASVRPDWAPVAQRIREQATDNWDDTVAVDRFTAKGGVFVRGRGRVLGPGLVEAAGEQVSVARAIVVATGAHAAIPPIEGLDAVRYWTNHDVVEAKELPESIVVLGGGAIGSELAQVLARFAVRVHLVEAADRLLPLQEPEAGALLAEVFAAEGISVHTGTAAVGVAEHDEQIAVTLADGSTLSAQRLLVATGRRVDVAGVGLDTVGVPADARFAPVDDRLRVGDGVYAVGDVTGVGAFTHVSMYQADVAIRAILGEPGPAVDYRALPRVTFTDPEVGFVGMTEQQARDSLANVRVGSTQVPSTARGWLHASGNEGFIKLVEDADRGVLVGATAMGPAGGEVLGALSVAVHAQVPTATLQSMIYAYPTFHRGIEDALRALR